MLQKIRVLYRAFSDRQLWLYSACACYHILLSLIPASLLVLSLLSAIPVRDQLTQIFSALLPEDIYALFIRLTGLVRQRHSVSLLSVSALIALWSAARGIGSIQAGLDHMMGCDRSDGFFVRRLRAVCALLPLLLSLGLLMALELAARTLLPLLGRLFPGVIGLLFTLLRHRLAAGTVLLALLSALVYRIVPTVRCRPAHCLLTGLLTALTWEGFSLLFSVYMADVSAYPALYGTVGAVFLSLVWLQACIQVILYGGRFLMLLTK